MEDGFYADRLSEFNCSAEIPNLNARNKIQEIQSQLASGHMDEQFKNYFRELLSNYNNIDAVILGCTELPLVIHQSDTSLPLLNPIEIQCKEAMDYVITES